MIGPTFVSHTRATIFINMLLGPLIPSHCALAGRYGPQACQQGFKGVIYHGRLFIGKIGVNEPLDGQCHWHSSRSPLTLDLKPDSFSVDKVTHPGGPAFTESVFLPKTFVRAVLAWTKHDIFNVWGVYLTSKVTLFCATGTE